MRSALVPAAHDAGLASHKAEQAQMELQAWPAWRVLVNRRLMWGMRLLVMSSISGYRGSIFQRMNTWINSIYQEATFAQSCKHVPQPMLVAAGKRNGLLGPGAGQSPGGVRMCRSGAAAL